MGDSLLDEDVLDVLFHGELLGAVHEILLVSVQFARKHSLLFSLRAWPLNYRSCLLTLRHQQWHDWHNSWSGHTRSGHIYGKQAILIRFTNNLYIDSFYYKILKIAPSSLYVLIITCSRYYPDVKSHY